MERIVRFIRQEAAALWIFALVFMAGALNAAGFLQYGQTLSHMTGNLTKLGLTMTGQSPEPFWWFFVFILCFILGATVSGYAFPNHSRGQWRRCELVLITSGALLLLSAFVHRLPPLRMTLLALRYRRHPHPHHPCNRPLDGPGRGHRPDDQGARLFGREFAPLPAAFVRLALLFAGRGHNFPHPCPLARRLWRIDLCGFLYVLLGGLMLLNLFKA